jgi:hypothetical protein
VCLSIADWAESTSTLSNAGSSATWTDLDMVVEVNRDILGSEKLTVRVMDENATRRDSVLGAGLVSLGKLCARLNTPVEVGIDLVAENGKSVGRVVVTAVLSEGKLADMTEGLPVSAVVVNRAQLVVRRIAAADLKGGDKSFFGDKPVSLLQYHAPRRGALAVHQIHLEVDVRAQQTLRCGLHQGRTGRADHHVPPRCIVIHGRHGELLV